MGRKSKSPVVTDNNWVQKTLSEFTFLTNEEQKNLEKVMKVAKEQAAIRRGYYND